MTFKALRRHPSIKALPPFLAAGLILVLAAPEVRAEVLEIDASGSVTIHDRPEVTLAAGARPIAEAEDASVGQARPRLTRERREDLAAAAEAAELSPDLVEAVAWRESGVTSGVVSKAGAVGEMQLMPATARALGVDPYDTRQNLNGGAAYLSWLLRRYDGNMVLALAAYDAGPGAVDRFGGVPPYKETQDYVAAILNRLSQRAGGAPER